MTMAGWFGEPWLALPRFALACLGSVVLAALLHALLRRAATRWPALLAHRSVWLAAQTAVVLACLLALVPAPRAGIAPVLSLPAPDAVAATTALTEMPDAPDAPAAPKPARAVPESDLAGLAYLVPDWLPAAWLGIYLAGLAWHGARRLRSRRHWQLLLRQARILDAAELRACPAMTHEQRRLVASACLTVRATDLPVSPMLHGVRRPCLLLPAHMAALDVGQQRMIVEHELAHWRRADPSWLALSAMLALAFWFNRPLRRLHEALRDAVELGCDDAVLAGRGGAERQGYAAALVAQLRLQAHGFAPATHAAAFGSLGVAARIGRMRMAHPPRLSRRGRLLAGAGIAACAVAGSLLQPTFSTAAPVVAMPAPLALTAPAEAAAPHVHATWRYPLAAPRVTSLYGVRSPSRPEGHHGIDLAARRGAPVLAVAGGSVSEVAFDEAWGHYVRVDHGGGRSSLLIHLDRVDAAPGQRVAAGDPLGAAGSSGKATGPHLHLEYWQDGRRLDPALVLPDLLAHATPKAIAQRAAQGNPVPTDL